MNKPTISAIAAIGLDREMGKGGDLIWKFKSDFIRLKSIVKNKPLIMGRKTYESIGVELPYSPSIVITRQKNYKSPFTPTRQTTVVSSLVEAIATASSLNSQEIIIFGGAGVYAEAMQDVQRLYLTIINDRDESADTYFPEYNEFTNIISQEVIIEDGKKITFQTLER